MEEVIKRHPAVNEACVVGIPDPACMELPIAAIQKRNGEKVDPEEIFSLLKSNMQIYITCLTAQLEVALPYI